MENNSEIKSNVERLELYSDNYPFNLPLRIRRFENETDYSKFIKSCEGLIRKSIEYKDWRSYIIDILGINTCVLTNERIDEVTIDLHHHVPSLYMVVKSIVNRKLKKEQEFSSFDICLEVIELHFMNKIGYVTLLTSMHEKFHNGFLDIPMNLVKGDYLYFIKEFSEYLDEEDLNIINQRMSINETNCSWSKNNYKQSDVA